MTATDLAGQVLGEYKLVIKLGEGGMGAVYKAYSLADPQHFLAIKVLSSRLAGSDDLINRFLREAKALAALSHLHILRIIDVASQNDVRYLVMEYLEGKSLENILSERKIIPDDKILHVARQISEALDYAHNRRLVHRDVKPSNIMIDHKKDDFVTLMDFGLVKVLDGVKITRTDIILGTPEYMAPEQIRGEQVDGRADVYSLGIIIYQMLTGKSPFQKPTTEAVLYAQVNERPPAMWEMGAEVPPEVESVVLKALAKDPDKRYQSAGALVDDLERAMKVPGSFEMPVIGTTPPLVEPIKTSVPPPKRRRIWPMLAAGILIEIAIIFAALFGPTLVARVPWLEILRPVPVIRQFSVSPAEIVQGESVAIEWDVGNVDSVSIGPGIQQNLPPSGRLVQQPTETTVYELIVPGGGSHIQQVVVNPAPEAPVIEFFQITPQEQVRGGEVELSWRVTGQVTNVEITANFQTMSALSPEDKITLAAEQTTSFILTAYNGDLRTSSSIQLKVVDPPTLPPPPTPTFTPMPTPTPTPTSTPTVTPPPPTPTPILTPEPGASLNWTVDQSTLMYVPGISGVDPFWIDRHEVTNAQFDAFVKATGYKTTAEKNKKAWKWKPQGPFEVIWNAYWFRPLGPNKPSVEETMQHPVVSVSWDDAAAYCEWAGKRLPTEAEWQLAAFGIDGWQYPWGNETPTGQYLNYCDAQCQWGNKAGDKDGFARTAPVCQYGQGLSPYELCDMGGNVWEWTADWDAEGKKRVIRGGSWAHPAGDASTSGRASYEYNGALDVLGFRCVHNADFEVVKQGNSWTKTNP
ncbi:MAG: SUMF1/EgtB/PvdO family nonheme iron enzyme [Anaerolineae bacterium]|nr:SUMF1/EgtB/PvdO family nonheme iron enzyme [Anaerolineae bacterium]